MPTSRSLCAIPWLLLAFQLGCGEASPAGNDDTGSSDDHGDEPRSTAYLVAPGAWLPAAELDPVPAHRPADADCTLGFGEEFGVFEIDTRSCNYGVFSQPLLEDVHVGEIVEFSVTHDDLISDTPAMGHVVIAFGDRIVFSADVEIPGAYGIVTDEWIADARVEAGTTAVLHLHNHGFNQWRLVAIARRPAG